MIFKYNSKIFEQYRKKLDDLKMSNGNIEEIEKLSHFQLGFFHENSKVLFVGIRPGHPFNDSTRKHTEVVQNNETFEKFESDYEELIKNSLIGKFIDKCIDGKWDKISFTNLVKTAHKENAEPAKEEILEFSGILATQIDYLNPQLIILMGRIVGDSYGFKSGEAYKPMKRIDGKTYVMAHHPSYYARINESKQGIEMYKNVIKRCADGF